jgi:transcriptional regulator
MVQARGIARAVEDPSWLHKQIRGLTDMMEGRRPQPWAVDDAPPPFVDAQVRGIVGIEIELRALDGKWKASQNRHEADRGGVVEGLASLGTDDAAAMAALVLERGRPA